MNSNKVHYNITGFPHALLVWAYESIPTIAGKFMTKHVKANPHMLSWTSTDNVKFNAVMLAITAIGKKQEIFILYYYYYLCHLQVLVIYIMIEW